MRRTHDAPCVRRLWPASRAGRAAPRPAARARRVYGRVTRYDTERIRGAAGSGSPYGAVFLGGANRATATRVRVGPKPADRAARPGGPAAGAADPDVHGLGDVPGWRDATASATRKRAGDGVSVDGPGSTERRRQVFERPPVEIPAASPGKPMSFHRPVLALRRRRPMTAARRTTVRLTSAPRSRRRRHPPAPPACRGTGRTPCASGVAGRRRVRPHSRRSACRRA